MLKRKKYKVFPVLLSNKGNNTEHIWLSGPLQLNDNDDVNITDPQDGDLLIYDYVDNKQYFGGGFGASGGYPNWNVPHWDTAIDPTSWSWQNESFAGRKFPSNGITRIICNGQVDVPHFKNVRIKVYWGRCLSNDQTTMYIPPQSLTCLGEYDTGIPVMSSIPGGPPFKACFQFSLGGPFTGVNGEYTLDSHSKLFYSVSATTVGGTGNNEIKVNYPLFFEISSSLETNGEEIDPPLANECSPFIPPPPPAAL